MRGIHVSWSTISLAAVIVLGWTETASSAVIDYTIARTNWAAPIEVDLKGPATSGTLVSAAFGADGQAQAIQSISGEGAVMLEGSIANGLRGNTLEAVTQWRDGVTNDTADPRSFRVDISIPEIQLFFSGSGFDGSHLDRRAVVYEINLFVNGSNLWNSGGALLSGSAGHVLQKSGIDLGGVKSPADLRYTFAPSSHSVFVGTIASAQSLEMRLQIRVGADIPGFEISTDASIGNPFGVERVQAAFVEIPEPGLSAMLITGSMALAYGGRARRQTMEKSVPARHH